LPETGVDLIHSGEARVGLPGPEPVANLAELPAEPIGAAVYTVQRGDTLSRIAKTHGTSVRALQAANGLPSDFLFIGQKLQLPD
jgi:flagellar protein FlgJ